jgi:hypothetical protein
MKDYDSHLLKKYNLVLVEATIACVQQGYRDGQMSNKKELYSAPWQDLTWNTKL